MPAPPTIELLAPNVTKPAYVAPVDELLINAPPALMPVPEIVKASALLIVWPFKSSTAPKATVVPAAVVPNAAGLPNLSVPAETVVAPV